MIWFIMLTYCALIATCFYVANSENTKATKAREIAETSLKHAEALDAGIRELKSLIEKDSALSDTSYQAIMDAQLKNDLRVEELKKKLEWLEMKVSNMPKASPSPTHVVLTQDKPLQFTVITREGPPAQLKKNVGANPQTVKNIKKQLKELSQ